MDYIESTFSYLNLAKDRLLINGAKSFEGMTAQRWVRIILIVGAYMLLRPYLLKAAANRQKAHLEKEADELGLGERPANANDLRGGSKKTTAGKEGKKGGKS
jgi:hypothetical protein